MHAPDICRFHFLHQVTLFQQHEYYAAYALTHAFCPCHFSPHHLYFLRACLYIPLSHPKSSAFFSSTVVRGSFAWLTYLSRFGLTCVTTFLTMLLTSADSTMHALSAWFGPLCFVSNMKVWSSYSLSSNSFIVPCIQVKLCFSFYIIITKT